MKKIPKFKSIKEEQEFWASADSTQYIDWKKGRKMVPPRLKPSVNPHEALLPRSEREGLKND